MGRERHSSLVDHDGDGLIELSSQAVDEIKEALTSDYESDEIDEASEKFKVIRDKVGIYVLEDPSGDSDSGNVFSWDIKKYFNQCILFYVKTMKRGFTLMELLIVLAIMGVMMGLVGFSILGGETNLVPLKDSYWYGTKARTQAALSRFTNKAFDQ